MFKLNMKTIRQSANDAWLMANPANAANLANESGKNGAQISRQPPKLAGLAKLAISQQLNCTLQAGPANNPANSERPAVSLEKPAKRSFMEWADTWRELDQAYQAHHFNCPTCIAAGKGYGLRCGAGMALWTPYDKASERQAP